MLAAWLVSGMLAQGSCAPSCSSLVRLGTVADPAHDVRQGTIAALTEIARTERLRGLFRGLGPTVLTNAPFSALYYLFYTRLKDRLAQVGSLSHFLPCRLWARASSLSQALLPSSTNGECLAPCRIWGMPCSPSLTELFTAMCGRRHCSGPCQL